ncbi:Site-specific recombinase XerD [Zunongwangia mangrovi]|uniref:Site-specific recombinase XerD n=1 Tax=Zunongwangia mangrovi TaxID=1334022 RepID=A0A1I1IX52_9FLAO|nr:site-specific integrase [Zunongwangia mangrovi]SFC38273.1 Site-specific recombinase XerD [Zunongwangia mangrovi]
MKISLRKKKLSTGKFSLYLEYYKGSETLKNGKTKHYRDFEYLREYLFIEPKDRHEKKQNEETIIRAEQILSIRRAEYAQGKYGIKDRSKGKINFLAYFDHLKDERYESHSNYHNWHAAQKQLEAYCNHSSITFDEVDESFVYGFKKYLDDQARTVYGDKLSQNTKYTYFNKLKAALRAAFNEGYTNRNYATSVKGYAQTESKREYLTHQELQKLMNKECRFKVLKSAFLFSCLTGLRWSDVHKLTWSEIRDEGQNTKIVFHQQKTKDLEYQYISNQARTIMGDRKDSEDPVFKGLKYGVVYNKALLDWCKKAGIKKHITFHSARHTHAVLLLEYGADIYTVSKVLGHKEIKTTQIYAKMVDKKKKEAARLIPEIQTTNVI